MNLQILNTPFQRHQMHKRGKKNPGSLALSGLCWFGKGFSLGSSIIMVNLVACGLDSCHLGHLMFKARAYGKDFCSS